MSGRSAAETAARRILRAAPKAFRSLRDASRTTTVKLELEQPWFSVQPCASNKSHTKFFLHQHFYCKLNYEVKMVLAHKSKEFGNKTLQLTSQGSIVQGKTNGLDSIVIKNCKTICRTWERNTIWRIFSFKSKLILKHKTCKKTCSHFHYLLRFLYFIEFSSEEMIKKKLLAISQYFQ